MRIASVAQSEALLLVAHGERRAGATNRTLHAHAAALQAEFPGTRVAVAVLRGAPGVVEAVAALATAGVRRIRVLPFFMSDGYFVSHVLAGQLAGAAFTGELDMMPPFGLSLALPDLVLAESIDAATRGGFEPREASLLVLGHGSTKGRASADATISVAARVGQRGVFATVEAVFLEEAPFLDDALTSAQQPIVIAGLFSGEGLHGWEDVPEALAATNVRAVYTGPVGASARATRLIATALSCCNVDARAPSVNPEP